MNSTVKLNIVGKIIRGDNPGWYILIKDDRGVSGGFFILQFKKKREKMV